MVISFPLLLPFETPKMPEWVRFLTLVESSKRWVAWKGIGEMVQVFSIFPQIGMGGGGKVKAIFKRMNDFAQGSDVEATILTIHHRPAQHRVYRELVKSGRIHKKVRFCSLFEAAGQTARTYTKVPDFWLPAKFKGTSKLSTFDPVRQVETVVRNQSTKRFDFQRHQYIRRGKIEFEVQFLNGKPSLAVQTNPDGSTFSMYFADGCLVAAEKEIGETFIYGLNYISRRRYRMRYRFLNSFTKYAVPEDSVTFIDGVTTAYLSRSIKSSKVLFLHADHRGIDGETVPRSRSLVEGFDGSAIVTATHAHRDLLLHDLHVTKPIFVIPHSIDLPKPKKKKRTHLCTVSRLDLEGKPIDVAIKAFAKIMADLPGVDYHIYGAGKGEEELAQLIKELKCDGRVKLMGYTSDPLEVFGKSIASVYPTVTEGFGLSILESLSKGCPVVSFEVNYGPRELIISGQNGELVPLGDVDELARQMVNVVKNASHYQKNCLTGLRRYSASRHRKNYRNLIDHVADLENLEKVAVSGGKTNAKAHIEKLEDHWELASKSPTLVQSFVDLADVLKDKQRAIKGRECKIGLMPHDPRPLMKLLYLNRSMGDLPRVSELLSELNEKFPEAFEKFISNKPKFKALLPSKNIAAQ